ncbi:YheT family hydrolase [Nevskia ramosa]|uniref:YheT family hydrolase n=1 Tax=Nevskia ramosa TaxID=64002 RepID=UPI0023555999|nr:alpha/beta fold hydrolase [Nevskia ramosa]
MSSESSVVGLFRPSLLLAPQLIQTVLAGKRPVIKRWQKRGNGMHEGAMQHLLDCGVDESGQQVRLTGMHSRQPADRESRGLVVLIHGWEGSHESAYLYSMAARVFEAGWNVFRLNLRDHAGTHGLNERMFHSARIDEVLNAVRAIQAIDGAEKLAVIGFSLGGNFALRVGLLGPAAGIVPQLSIGISPSIDPGATLLAIDNGPTVFKRYFLDKWRKTLDAKAEAWPGRYDFSELKRIDSFVGITRRFVVEHTEYDTLDDYLATYTLTPPMLMGAASPLAVLTAQDDTVIPIRDFDGLGARGSVIAYDAPRRGGHCGFIENLRLESWAERRVAELLERL